VVHAIDQPRIVGVGVAEFFVEPVFEAFDVEMDGFQKFMFDAELPEERDLGRVVVAGERGVLEGDDSLGEVLEEFRGVRVYCWRS
jgi:hypothetical protein